MGVYTPKPVLPSECNLQIDIKNAVLLNRISLIYCLKPIEVIGLAQSEDCGIFLVDFESNSVSSS